MAQLQNFATSGHTELQKHQQGRHIIIVFSPKSTNIGMRKTILHLWCCWFLVEEKIRCKSFGNILNPSSLLYPQLQLGIVLKAFIVRREMHLLEGPDLGHFAKEETKGEK